MEGVQVLNPWLIRGRGDPDAPFRLICFHSMGVGASLFTKFLLNPPDDYDILAVQTPGRENRMAEPVVESVDELVDQIVPQLLPLFDRPVVIWGHSFGGIVAWEVIRRLRERASLRAGPFRGDWHRGTPSDASLAESRGPAQGHGCGQQPGIPDFVVALCG